MLIKILTDTREFGRESYWDFRVAPAIASADRAERSRLSRWPESRVVNYFGLACIGQELIFQCLDKYERDLQFCIADCAANITCINDCVEDYSNNQAWIIYKVYRAWKL